MSLTMAAHIKGVRQNVQYIYRKIFQYIKEILCNNNIIKHILCRERGRETSGKPDLSSHRDFFY